MSRIEDITVCLLGFEKHKAKVDLSYERGFWLCLNTADAEPFIAAFKKSGEVFHEFQIDRRVGKKTGRSTLVAQIVQIEEGPTETRLELRPHPSYLKII